MQPLMALASSTSTLVLSDVVSSSMVSGIFDEIVGLLPVLLPVTVGFIGIRKALAFLKSTLKSA